MSSSPYLYLDITKWGTEPQGGEKSLEAIHRKSARTQASQAPG